MLVGPWRQRQTFVRPSLEAWPNETLLPCVWIKNLTILYKL